MHRKVIVGLLVVGLFLSVSWLILTKGLRIQNPFKIPIVSQLKLSEISNTVTEVKFASPQAIQTVLVLGFSNQIPISSFADGRIIISNNSGTSELLLNERTMTPCNWLQKFSLNGYLLSDPNSGGWNWKNTLISGNTNLLIITNIPTGCSIWLFHTRPSAWDSPWARERSTKSRDR